VDGDAVLALDAHVGVAFLHARGDLLVEDVGEEEQAHEGGHGVHVEPEGLVALLLIADVLLEALAVLPEPAVAPSLGTPKGGGRRDPLQPIHVSQRIQYNYYLLGFVFKALGRLLFVGSGSGSGCAGGRGTTTAQESIKE
jgi:hypothetical protein